MDTKEFRELIKIHLRPSINKLGFSGSNHHFINKRDNHFIYCFVIQANKYGGSCVLEAGVTLDFLPLKGNSKSVTVYDCDFRKRISPKQNQLGKLLGRNQEKWFEYGNSKERAIKSIEEMSEVIDQQLLDYCNQFSDFPDLIIDISLDEIISGSRRLYDLGAPPKLRLALLVSRTHKYIGKDHEARLFARWGLENIGEATGLTKDFSELIQEE